MKLDKNINYIVSGLERSGTSMMMQILHAGGLTIAFDNLRLPDENNPKGYYELEGGKIINKLMNGSFSFDKHKGEFVKITAYGLKYLSQGNYKIIYMERNIEEILDSMEKMAEIKGENRPETQKSFLKLNQMSKNFIANRDDIEVLYVNYNEMISNPEQSIRIIASFLNLSDVNLDKMTQSIDKKLYRQRRET
jgi:hypothetical protein